MEFSILKDIDLFYLNSRVFYITGSSGKTLCYRIMRDSIEVRYVGNNGKQTYYHITGNKYIKHLFKWQNYFNLLIMPRRSNG